MADMKTPATAVTKRPARTPLYTAARVLAACTSCMGWVYCQ